LFAVWIKTQKSGTVFLTVPLWIENEKTSNPFGVIFGTKLSFWNISHASEGTEELAHVEMISSMLYQLTRGLSIEEIKQSGFDKYFVDHTTGVYPVSAAGVPFSAAYLQSKGDVFADLNEDLAAEQKARATYDNLLRLADDPDVKDVLRFLREREIVHYQRFGEALGIARDGMCDKSNYYAYNPSFDRP
jgi:spore coat protein JC